MQVYTSLQTDNHARTTPRSFLQPGCPSYRPTNSVKAMKAAQTHNTRQDRITRRHCINHRPTNAHSNLCLKDNKSVNQFLKFRSGTIIIFRCYSVTCIYSYVNTHTHNRLTASVRVNPGRPVPEETLTHSHPTWSSDILYHLSPLIMIHGILFVHFTCLTILSDNLSPGPLCSWTLNFILHTFLHPITVM